MNLVEPLFLKEKLKKFRKNIYYNFKKIKLYNIY